MTIAMTGAVLRRASAASLRRLPSASPPCPSAAGVTTAAASVRRSTATSSSSSSSSVACLLKNHGPRSAAATTNIRHPPAVSTLGGPRCHFSSSTASSSSSDLTAKPQETSPDARTSSDGVVGVPIDFDLASKVEGNESQIVTIGLEPGQVLRAESGAMMYMTDGVTMNTTTGGGLSAGFKRMLTGQNVFISDYVYEGEPGTKGIVALGTDFPSKIVRLNVDEWGGKIVAQKGALLCASHTIDIEMEFTRKFTTGFFGGEGFVLQALTGEGDVFLKAGGTLIRRELAEGEQLRIASGALVAFSNGVDFDIQTMPGFKNVLFGGEGLFVTTLTGPGTVWLQGQPPQRMISEIARRVPSGGVGLAVPIGGVSGGGGEGGGEGGSEGEAST